MSQHTATENQQALSAFHDAVNMSAKELEAWLKTEESQAVGFKEHEGDESIGHKAAHDTIELLHKKSADYTEADYHHMRRVVSYIHRHLAQKPEGDIEHTRWRYSLKNWGHDPVKDKG